MYRLQSDNVRLFISESCEASDFTPKAIVLYNAYRNYCVMSSLKPYGKQKFYERLESLGYQMTSYAHVNYFNLRIVEE